MTACAHGMPIPASCVDCMDEGPVAPPTPQHLDGDREIAAIYEGRCARRRQHGIDPGDLIVHVDGLGWCCIDCARVNPT